MSDGREDRDMTPIELDLDTADRILSGTVAVADAPPGFESVVALLGAAAAIDETDEIEGFTEWRAAAAMAATMESRRRGPYAGGRFHRRTALTLVCAITVFTATAGLAVAGALPGPAQHVVSRALHHVGVTVPDSSDAPAQERHTGSDGSQSGRGDGPAPTGTSKGGADIAHGDPGTKPGKDRGNGFHGGAGGSGAGDDQTGGGQSGGEDSTGDEPTTTGGGKALGQSKTPPGAGQGNNNGNGQANGLGNGNGNGNGQAHGAGQGAGQGQGQGQASGQGPGTGQGQGQGNAGANGAAGGNGKGKGNGGTTPPEPTG